MLLSHPFIVLIPFVLLLTDVQNVQTQRTALDDILAGVLRQIKRLSLPIFGRTSEEPHLVQRVRNNRKTQHLSERLSNMTSLCPDSPKQRRSAQPPTSVHRLRPGDIDIVGAMGDSLSSGNAIYSSNIVQVFIENRGRSATIGGQGTWRDQLTIPNILKEFNPNLYGYSLRDGKSTDRSSKFNVAEPGAMSRDMLYMARVLVKRMRRDPHVNMTDHWKLISYFIGANDFCADMCYHDDPAQVLKSHKRDLLESLRYLRDNVPRLIVNLIAPPTMHVFRDVKGLPPNCRFFRLSYCPCQIGYGRTKSQLDYHKEIMDRWLALDKKVASLKEFNTDTFTINFISCLNLKKFPEKKNGQKLLELLAEDCFHFSAYGQAVLAKAIWNSMLKWSADDISVDANTFDDIRCPATERPFLATRANGQL